MFSHSVKNPVASNKNNNGDKSNTVQVLPSAALAGVSKPKATRKRARPSPPPSTPAVVPKNYPMTRSKVKKIDDLIQMGEVLCMCSPPPNGEQGGDGELYCSLCHKIYGAAFKMLFQEEFEEVSNNINKLAAMLKMVSDSNSLRDRKTRIELPAEASSSDCATVPIPENLGGRNDIVKFPIFKPGCSMAPERLFIVNKDQEIAITSVCSLSEQVPSNNKNGNASKSVQRKTPLKKTNKNKNNSTGLVRPTYTKDKIVAIVLQEIKALEKELLGCMKDVEKSREEGYIETKFQDASILHRGCMKLMRRIVILQERLSKKPKNEILKKIADRLAILNVTHQLK